MKKLLVGLALLGSFSTFAAHESVSEFVDNNQLEKCKDVEVKDANYFSFTKIVSDANARTTKYHLSGDAKYINPKYTKPNFFECLLLGDECDKAVRIRNIKTPSNFESVIYEIVQDNSIAENYSHATGSPIGYGHGGTVKGIHTSLDLEVNPVAGKINELSGKLIRLTANFQGGITGAREQFALLNDAQFYCRK